MNPHAAKQGPLKAGHTADVFRYGIDPLFSGPQRTQQCNEDNVESVYVRFFRRITCLFRIFLLFLGFGMSPSVLIFVAIEILPPRGHTGFPGRVQVDQGVIP